jgi:hypothetical protein
MHYLPPSRKNAIIGFAITGVEASQRTELSYSRNVFNKLCIDGEQEAHGIG